jgi:hypothetical protein
VIVNVYGACDLSLGHTHTQKHKAGDSVLGGSDDLNGNRSFSLAGFGSLPAALLPQDRAAYRVARVLLIKLYIYFLLLLFLHTDRIYHARYKRVKRYIYISTI